MVAATARNAGASPFIILFVSVLAISWAAPLIRFAAADPLAISFWRLALALPIIAVLVTARGEWDVIRAMRCQDWLLAAFAGILLAGHFASWIASVKLTSVAASVALVSTQPIWVALIAMPVVGERPSASEWLGIGAAVVGAVVIGLGDLRAGPAPIRGDALALLGALLVAGYYVIGRGVRSRVPLWPYVAVVYGIAAVALLVALLVRGGSELGPYAARDWLVFAGLALGPMLVGHGGQNWALGYLPAYLVNLSLLGEPVGATLISWALPAIDETPPIQAVVGGSLILVGIMLGLRRK